MLDKNQTIAGIDEAGRGPLFGPVVACAVIFNDKIDITEIKDSKKISPIKRQKIFTQLINQNIDYGVGVVHEDVIDEINILNATKEAMLLAVSNLKNRPDELLIDGNQLIKTDIKQKAIVKGDEKISEISAASIIAKVTRDKIVESYSKIYPMFDLMSHKGYGTKKHIELLYEYGATKIHRHTFKPISNIGYDSFIEYESLSIIRYGINLIKKGFYIDNFHIKEDIGFIHYKTEKIDVCLVSLDKNNRDILLPNIISKVKEKDSVNKVRLDVIYSDDKSNNPKVMYSCEDF